MRRINDCNFIKEIDAVLMDVNFVWVGGQVISERI